MLSILSDILLLDFLCTCLDKIKHALIKQSVFTIY